MIFLCLRKLKSQYFRNIGPYLPHSSIKRLLQPPKIPKMACPCLQVGIYTSDGYNNLSWVEIMYSAFRTDAA